MWYHLGEVMTVPRKDIDSRREYGREYVKKMRKIYAINVSVDSGIPDAISAAIGANTAVNAYIINAVCEKLVRDGYDPENYKPKKPEE